MRSLCFLGRSIPDWPKLLHLYSRLKPGKTVFEWMKEFNVEALGIDVRRFTSFGVIKVYDHSSLFMFISTACRDFCVECTGILFIYLQIHWILPITFHNHQILWGRTNLQIQLLSPSELEASPKQAYAVPITVQYLQKNRCYAQDWFVSKVNRLFHSHP